VENVVLEWNTTEENETKVSFVLVTFANRADAEKVGGDVYNLVCVKRSCVALMGCFVSCLFRPKLAMPNGMKLH
jgi:hypothetical protein